MKKFEHPIYVTRPLIPNKEVLNERLEKVWDSKWLTNVGRQHLELEKNLKEYLKIENLCIFNNGTSALIIGMKALGLTGEVITTPFTFPATVQAIEWAGATPVFCDVEEETLNIDANKIESLITDKTRGIVAVHVFGNPCNVKRIEEIANKYNLKVFYDGAHTFGSKLKNVPIGKYGDMTMFSFHATKLFNTVEGGALVYNNSKYNEILKQYKNFGYTENYEIMLSGTNAKLNEVSAAIGIEVLKCVEEERKKRHEIMQVYKKRLKNVKGLKIVTNLEGEESSYQYFVIQVNEKDFGISRDKLHMILKEYNVFTRKYFYPLCSSFSWFKDNISRSTSNLLVANKIVNETLALPYYGELGRNQVNDICDMILEVNSSWR